MKNDLFLTFKLEGKTITVKRDDEGVLFEATDTNGTYDIDVEESVKCKMYKFDINKNKCLVAFDEDDICLHIKKENGLDYIYYSLEGDDSRMYSIDEIKDSYKSKSINLLEMYKKGFEGLISDMKEISSIFKYSRLNKIKNDYFRDLDYHYSLFLINLFENDYLFELKEFYTNLNNAIIDCRKTYINELRNEIKG